MSKNKRQTEFIYGKNAVEEAIKQLPERINKILISNNVKKDAKINNVITQAKENGVLFQFAPPQKLDTVTEDARHQGIVAMISPIKYVEIDDFLNDFDKEDALVILLDGVEDPHNLGAIARTAVCAGADAVIIPERRSANVNATVQKTSAGAINKIPIIKVNNLNNSIDKLKEKGFWIFGAEASGSENYFDVDYKGNCGIVLGGENRGISKLVSENCDYLVKIPMLSDFNSLNVSNAASILIYEAIKQRIAK